MLRVLFWLLFCCSVQMMRPIHIPAWFKRKPIVLVAAIILANGATAFAQPATPATVYVAWMARQDCSNGQCRTVQYNGSGVIVGQVEPNKYAVLTAYHVVKGYSTAGTSRLCVYRNTERYEATIAKVDTANDIAVLTIQSAAVLPCVPLADSLPAVGTEAWISGYPLSRFSTLATRIMNVTSNRTVLWTQGGMVSGVSGGPIVAGGKLVALQCFKGVGNDPSGCGPNVLVLRTCLLSCFGRLPSVVVVNNNPPPASAPSEPIAVNPPVATVPTPSETGPIVLQFQAVSPDATRLVLTVGGIPVSKIHVKTTDAAGQVSTRDYAPGDLIKLEFKPTVSVPKP